MGYQSKVRKTSDPEKTDALPALKDCIIHKERQTKDIQIGGEMTDS